MINKNRLVKLTQKVISINSENPPGNELALARFIQKDMKSLGLDVKTYSYEKGRPNIVAILRGSLPRKQAASEALLLTPHFDTVPIGNGWKYDSMGSQIVNGKIYGRGASDDKGNLASCMEVMRSLVEDNVRLKRDVIMAATVDEETGSHCGIIPLLKNKVLKPRFALVMDSDEFDVITAQKGLMHLTIRVFGKKAHGAYNWLGVNAIEIVSAIINDLKRVKFKYKKHSLLHAPTVNVGVIKGGDKVNMVADFCEFALDVRFMPSMDPKETLRIIKRVVSGRTKKFKIIVDDLQQPYEIKRNHPYVKKYLEITKLNRAKARIKGSEGATVITFFKKYGIPAVATGYGASGTAHANDEYIKVKTLFDGTKVLEQFVKESDLL